MRQSLETKFYPERRFGGFTDIDGTVAFFTRINALLEPSFTVLDVGCGRGAGANNQSFKKNLLTLRGKVAKVIGIDVDPRARDNPFLDEFRLIAGEVWPIGDDSIDMIVCDNVLEHIPEPDKFFSEVVRCLRNNGIICIRTPNRWNYVGLAATIIPNKYHAKVTSFVQDARHEEDVFPTVYKCNSVWALQRMMCAHGFDCVVYGYEAEPSYLSFSGIAYFFGVVHQKLAPGFMKAVLFAFGRIRK